MSKENKMSNRSRRKTRKEKREDKGKREDLTQLTTQTTSYEPSVSKSRHRLSNVKLLRNLARFLGRSRGEASLRSVHDALIKAETELEKGGSQPDPREIILPVATRSHAGASEGEGMELVLNKQCVSPPPEMVPSSSSSKPLLKKVKTDKVQPSVERKPVRKSNSRSSSMAGEQPVSSLKQPQPLIQNVSEVDRYYVAGETDEVSEDPSCNLSSVPPVVRIPTDKYSVISDYEDWSVVERRKVKFFEDEVCSRDPVDDWPRVKSFNSGESSTRGSTTESDSDQPSIAETIASIRSLEVLVQNLSCFRDRNTPNDWELPTCAEEEQVEWNPEGMIIAARGEDNSLLDSYYT